MRIKYLFFFVFLLIFACKKVNIDPDKTDPETIKPEDETEEDDENKNENQPEFYKENSWIYQQMRRYYLWDDKMPLEDSTDKNLAPTDYFYSLIYKEKDRFSYIKETYEEVADYWNGNLRSFGFRYSKFLDVNGNLILAVTLVLKNSPAEKAGLKRGDLIKKINNQNINPRNVETLLSSETGNFQILKKDASIKNIVLSKENFQLDPNQYYTVIKIDDKKIGYWVYTQFLFDKDNETRQIFQDFKENNIDELVVDFRFNPGGVTPMAEVVASLMGPGLGNSTPLFYGKPNKYEENNQGGSPSYRYFTNESNYLPNLNRVFVLTSNSTSSSSELVINCLRPYRNVLSVGGHTYGKNLISIILADESGKIPYTLMPAWNLIYNINGESNYGKREGISPDFPVLDDILPLKSLGDSTETLLNRALSEILGRKIGEIKNDSSDLKLLDNFHYFDTGTGFLGNPIYN